MNTTIIEKIKLMNFRSHSEYDLDCDKKTTLILGENGWGKTSVLEAIYIALQGKSFRAADGEIIKREEEFYRVELDYKTGEKVVVVSEVSGGGYIDSKEKTGKTPLQVGDKKTKKTFLIRDKKTARLPKAQKYPVILFLPEDLHLIVTSPTKKREYFDRLINQLDDKYSVILSRYNKVLKQRNEALKNEFISEDSLFSWNIMLAKYGVDLRKKRQQVVEMINKRLTETYQTIADNEDKVAIDYKSYTGEVDESEYLRLLAMDFERDRITGHTNFGVHRDDYEFVFNGVLANGSASRGEVRSIILALKFIEAELVEDARQKKPLVLLDDVFSELDKDRQKSLVKNFKNHQVILTSVEGVEL